MLTLQRKGNDFGDGCLSCARLADEHDSERSSFGKQLAQFIKQFFLADHFGEASRPQDHTEIPRL
jgi:hypothetical protein